MEDMHKELNNGLNEGNWESKKLRTQICFIKRGRKKSSVNIKKRTLHWTKEVDFIAGRQIDGNEIDQEFSDQFETRNCFDWIEKILIVFQISRRQATVKADGLNW